MSKVLVIGESCLDEFIYCDAERLAPDLPIPILSVVEVKNNPGMAMNVFNNLSSYIKNVEIVTNKNWNNIKKTRIMDQKTNHAFIRIDTKQEIERLNLNHLNLDFELIVISDYNKGFISETDINEISQKHNNVFLDTKKKLGYWAENVRFIKINNHEYSRSLENINEKLESKIIRTHGSEGCYFQGKNFPVSAAEVKDSSGAGDSFMAALVVNFLETGNIIDAINFANLKASQVVKERGVSII